MLPSWVRQLFRQKFQGHGTVAPIQSLAVELLEDRALLTTATWTGAYSANHPTLPPDYSWSNPENWAPVPGFGFYRPNDDGDGVPDDVLFPSIPDGLAKPNAKITVVNNVPVFSFNPNSIIDDAFPLSQRRINDLRIEGDNYYITSLTAITLTVDGRFLVNFAGPVSSGPAGLSLLGPILTAAQPISNLTIVLNDNVTTNPGFGPANQFVNSNTGELYVSATLTDGFTPATATVRPSGIIKSGTGTISFAGNNTYSGVTAVQGGTLIAASDGALGSTTGQTLVSSGATIGVSGGTIGDSLQIIGTGVGGRGALRGIVDSFQVFSILSPPLNPPTGGGAWSGGISLLGDATIGVDSFLTNLGVITKGIGGTGTLTKVGNGELDLVVDSTYAGNTLITQGGVSIFTDAALSAGFQTIVSNEATLNLDGGLLVNETLVLTGDGFNGYNDGFGRPAGALTLLSGTSTWLGSITLTAAGASIGALGGSTLTLAGALNGPAATVLSKVERGRVRIARANTSYLGTTRIDNGTLEIADAAAVGAGRITVNATAGAQPAIGTLQLEGNYTLSQGLTLNGVGDGNAGAVHVVAPLGSGALGSSSVTAAGGIVLNSTTVLNVDPRSTLIVSGTISDVAQSPAAELDKLGGGTLVLSGTNTYTGQTVLRDGVTSIRSPGALGGTAAGTSVNTGAVLSLDGANGLTITGEPLAVAGANGFSTSTVRAGTAANVWAGPVNFIDNQGATVNVEASAGATLELKGSLGGTATVHKVGGGTVSFTGATANTLIGTIYVDAGTLALGNTGGNATNGAVVVGDSTGTGTDTLLLLASNQLADDKSVTVNSTGLFNLNGFSDTIGSAVALTVAGGRVQTGAGVLSLNGDVNAFAAGTTTNIDGNIDGNIFLTSTRTFLFLPTPQLTIQSSVNSSQFDSPVTFTVTGFPFGTEPAVAGTITFYDGDTRIGSVQTFQSNGVGAQTTAAVTTTSLSGGLHTIRAVYSGSNFYASTFITMAQSQAVRNTPVFATLGSSNLTAEPNPNLLNAPTPSQSVTFTYRASAPIGSIAPTGTVTFFDNGVQIGAAQTLTADGLAHVTTSFPVPTTAAERSHTITATYSGDLFYSSNTVNLSAPTDPNSTYTRPVTQQVGYDPKVQLTSDFNAAAGDRSATINFQVSGAAGQPTPSGTVQFFLDDSPVGSPVAVDASGRAALNLSVDVSTISDASWAGGVATITTITPHHLETGNTVTLTGLTPAGYNGTFTVTRVSPTQFTYALASNPGAFVPPRSTPLITSATWSTGTVTITTSVPHGLSVGSTVTVAGLIPGGYNGRFVVTNVLNATQYQYALATNPAGTFAASAWTVTNASWSGGAATITTSSPHGLATGATVTITGVTPAGYNGTYRITVLNTNQFSYQLVTSPGAFVASVARHVGTGVTSAAWLNGTATITTGVAHGLSVGDTVTISGLNPDGFNGTFIVTSVPSGTTFTYSLPRPTSPGAYVNGGSVLRTGAGISSGLWTGGVAFITTSGPHNLETGDVVTLAGITRAGYDGTFVVTRLSATQFSYSLPNNPGSFVNGNPLPAVNAAITGMTWNNGVVNVTTGAAHGLQTGDVVTISTNNTSTPAGSPVPTAAAGYDGTFVVTVVDATHFRYVLQLNPGFYVGTASPPSVSTTATLSVSNATWAGGVATITTATPHGLTTGGTVTLSGLLPAGYNGTYTVTVLNGNTFTYTLPANPGTFAPPTAVNNVTAQSFAITNAVWVGNTVTITTAAANGLALGNSVTISGVASTGPGNYNGTFLVSSVISANQFTYTLLTNPGTFQPPSAQATASTQIQNMTWTNGKVTVTTGVPHNLTTGQTVTISGALPPAYNGTYVVTVLSPTQFTYDLASDPGPFFIGTSNGSASRSALAVNTVGTVAPATLTFGSHSVTAEFRSSDEVFTDAKATYSVPDAANLVANTPVIYQVMSSRTAVQLSTIGGDDPQISDPASFTFRVNTNDIVNYQATGKAGDRFHPTPTGTVTFRQVTVDPATGLLTIIRTFGTVSIGQIGANGLALAGTPGEATLAGVTFPRSVFGVGTITIAAFYSGDQYYDRSTLTFAQTLIATNTAVKLSTDKSIAVVGEPVQFIVDASTLAAMNVPTVGAGFVNLTATNTTTGQVLPTIQFFLGNQGRPGVGVGALSFTTPGVYTIQAAFIATSTAIGSATVTLSPSLTVIAPLDAVVTSNSAPAAPAGSSVTFTFRSTVATNAGVSLAGSTVEFYDGINKIGTTQFLAADGTASITLSTLSTGTHTISAIITPPSGNPYPVTRVFMDAAQVVGTPPRLDVNVNNSTVVDGDAVTIQVTATGALGIPTGRVILYANGIPIVGQPTDGVLIRNGVATFTTTELTAATGSPYFGPRYTIEARYSGDAAYGATISTMPQDLVVINPVRFQVRSSANANVSGSVVNYPVAAGSTVTYTAELRTNSVDPGTLLPDATGSVTFQLFDSNNVLVATTGPIALNTVVVVIDAVTTIRTPTAIGTLTAPAGVGTYHVVAVYSGDVNYSPLTSTFDQPVVATAGNLPVAAPAATTAPRLVPTLNVNGSISGGATTGLISSASGTLVLNGTNSYGGTTLVTGAGNTLKLGTSNALPDTTALTVTAGTLNVNGMTDTVGSLSGTGTVQLPPGSSFTTGGLNTNTTFTGTLTGSGALNKVGTGALTLGGASPGYTGTTFVLAGTVFLAADLGASNAIVASGATLGGTGTLNAMNVNPGATLSPGGSVGVPNSIGIVTGNGNLTLTPGSQFVVDVKGTTAGNPTTGYDQYVLTGTAGVNLGGATLVFNLGAGYTPALGDSFVLVDVTGTGTITGTFAGLVDNATFTLNSRVYQVHYTATQATVTLIANESTATLASSVNPSSPGDSVTFTVTITPALATDPRPSLTGTVQFSVDGTPAGSAVSVVAGPGNSVIATFTTSTLLIGPHTITAQYTANDTNYQDRALTLTQLVTVPSVTTLTPQQGPIVFGDNAVFLAAVAQQSGLPVPTGTFTFTAGGVVLGTATLDATGRAVFSSTTIPVGTGTVTATYSGDSFYRASSGSATQAVDHQNRVVVGSDAGPIATVQVFDSRSGELLRTINPFDQYTLGVKVATGDVNGDGVADIVVSAGAGAPGGHVKVIDGVTFTELASFFTFIGFNGGVNVAVGDVDGDGFGDVVIGTAVANDHVKAFSGRLLISGQGIASDGTADPSTIQSFFAYSPNGGNTVGVTVGVGDVDGDGRVDIITGSATFAGHVKVFSGAGNGALIGSYFAYGAGYLGGINVAGGDLDGDGKAEVITGATNAPHVKALRLDGSEVASFFAFLNDDGSTPPFGARVGAADRNGDRLADILVGAGSGAPAVKVFSGLDPSQLLESFIATPPGQSTTSSGVFVGGSGPK